MICGMDAGKRWLLAAAVLLVALPLRLAVAQAVDPTPWVTWQCWLGNGPQYSVRCLHLDDIDRLADDTAAGAAPDPRSLRRDLLLNGAAPNLARLIREDPAHYGGRLWQIPLYNYPFDMERVSQLARSVMCGRDPYCSVRFQHISP